jgi:hypothetical protein
MRNELNRRLVLLEGMGGRLATPEEAAVIHWLLDATRDEFPDLVSAVEDAGAGPRGAAAVCDLLEAADPEVEEQFWSRSKDLR